MKQLYRSPDVTAVLFKTEEILGPSGGTGPILDPKDENNPKEPAKEFGSIQIF